MIITISGNNSYMTRRRLQELVDGFTSKHGELALERFDAEEAEPQSIFEALQSPPFLSEKKMLVIKNAGKNKQLAESIEQIIYSSVDGTDIILYELSTDKRTAFFKTLKNKTQLEEYGEMDPAKLTEWLVDEAKKLGAKLNPADAGYLLERAGPDQSKLAGEIEKLAVYNLEITKDNIDILVVKTPHSKVFDLLDAAFSGNKKKALALYDEQRAQKVEPQAILAMIAWQLQILTLAVTGGQRSAVAIASDAGLNPYPVQKAQGLARRIGPDNIRRLCREALKIDAMAKKSPIDVDEAIKNYISGI